MGPRQAVFLHHVLHAQQRSDSLGLRGGRGWLPVGAVIGGIEQQLGVGVRARLEQRRGRCLLDYRAPVHDQDPVGETGRDGKVVGDQHQRHALLSDQPLQQRKDFRLRGHVQRRGRFIGDQQARTHGDGHGDHHPLALPSRELVRIARQRQLRGGQLALLQYGLGALQRLLRGSAIVDANGLGDLLPDGLQRVEGGHRLLKHHADVASTDRTEVGLGGSGEVLPREQHPAARLAASGQQLHDR